MKIIVHLFSLIIISFTIIAGKEYRAYEKIIAANTGICNPAAALNNLPAFQPKTLILNNNKINTINDLLKLDAKFDTVTTINLEHNPLQDFSEADLNNLIRKFNYLQTLVFNFNNLSLNAISILNQFKRSNPYRQVHITQLPAFQPTLEQFFVLTARRPQASDLEGYDAHDEANFPLLLVQDDYDDDDYDDMDEE